MADNIWRGVISLGVAIAMTALVAVLGLWRNDARQDDKIATCTADNAAMREAYRMHAESDQRGREAVAVESRDAAVAFARLQAAVDAMEGAVNAMLASMRRR